MTKGQRGLEVGIDANMQVCVLVYLAHNWSHHVRIIYSYVQHDMYGNGVHRRARCYRQLNNSWGGHE